MKSWVGPGNESNAVNAQKGRIVSEHLFVGFAWQVEWDRGRWVMSPLVGCRKVLGWHQVGQFLPWLYKRGLLHYSHLGGALFLAWKVVLSECLQAKNTDCCKFVRKRAKVVATYYMYLAIGGRISYTPSVEHIVGWTMHKTLPFCPKTLDLFWLHHAHMRKGTYQGLPTYTYLHSEAGKPGKEATSQARGFWCLKNTFWNNGIWHVSNWVSNEDHMISTWHHSHLTPSVALPPAIAATQFPACYNWVGFTNSELVIWVGFPDST